MSERLKVMRELSEWVQQYGWKVYYNQKNTDGYPVFHANTNSKPDLLLQKNGYNILVEVKKGKKHNDILNGIDQTWKYAGEYYTGRHIYNLGNNKKLIIDAFVLATHYSHLGFLYAREAAINSYIENEELITYYRVIEKPISHSVARFLWRQWEKGFVADYFEELRIGKAQDSIILPKKPKVGILVARTEPITRQVYRKPHLYLNSNNFVSMDHDIFNVFSK